jgi:hypothetical protein
MPPVLAPDVLAAPAQAVTPPQAVAPLPAVALVQPPATAADRRHAGLLAQALRDHHDQPAADRAAQVLRCIDEAPTAAASTRGTGELFDLPALQARLSPADALVVYGRQGEELLACVVRAAGVQVFRRLARWHDVQAVWRQVRFQLGALCHGAGPPRAQWPHLLKRAQLQLQALHGLVWAPLADTLTDARRVLLLPGGGLAGLPFAALQDGLSCLAQRHLLAEVPSLDLALRGLSSPAEPSCTAVAGLPDRGVVVLGLGLGEPGVHVDANPASRAQALLASGAWRVLVRRWPVDDQLTAAFIDRFQQERQWGRGPAEALSEAQAGLMVNHPHPAFWAGFVLYGGW